MKNFYLKVSLFVALILSVGFASTWQSFHYHDPQAGTLYQTQCSTCEFAHEFHKLSLNHPALRVTQFHHVAVVSLPQILVVSATAFTSVAARAPPTLL